MSDSVFPVFSREFCDDEDILSLALFSREFEDMPTKIMFEGNIYTRTVRNEWQGIVYYVRPIGFATALD